MFKIFRGSWRGVPDNSEDQIFINIGVDFRRHLHHFKGAKLHVLLAIALHMNQDGHSFPSYRVLEKETGYGRDTISSALDELCGMKLEGRPVLIRWRERDEAGQFTGGNHYLLFPTDEEVQSPENPTLEKTNSGKSNHKKNQLEGKPEKDSGADAPPSRKPKAELDELFEALAAGSFGLSDMSLVGKVGGRIGKLRKWLTAEFPDHGPDDLRLFYAWYAEEYPGVDAPRDLDKFSEHYVRFASGARLQTATSLFIGQTVV